jgi:DNA-binding NarL/FixJ family response regulator
VNAFETIYLMTRTKILLADDHAMVADGLVRLLTTDFDIVGVVHDGRALVDAAETLNPDVIVTDLFMPMMNGLDAVREIRSRRPDARIIVLTMHLDTHLAADAFRSGVSGYLLKMSSGEELISAVREVAQGRSYVTTLMTKDLIGALMTSGAAPRQQSELTPRQREVVKLVAEGKTMKEVASLLNISVRTAESHKYETMQVLGVQTTAALIQYAVRTRLVDG